MSHALQQCAHSSALCHESCRSSDRVYRYQTSCSCALCTSERYQADRRVTWLTKTDISVTDRLSINRALNHLNFEPAEVLSVEKAIETAVCRRAVSE
jgi:excinuclease UvrABC ATPase subunit